MQAVVLDERWSLPADRELTAGRHIASHRRLSWIPDSVLAHRRPRHSPAVLDGLRPRTPGVGPLRRLRTAESGRRGAAGARGRGRGWPARLLGRPGRRDRGTSGQGDWDRPGDRQDEVERVD